jgi:hypothetical protein
MSYHTKKKIAIILHLENTFWLCVKFEISNSKRWGIEGVEIKRLSHHDARFITFMHATPYGKRLKASHNPFVLCFQEDMCKDLRLDNDGGAQKGCGPYVGTIGTRISPFFFDIMIHLLVHFIEQLEICGAVHT